MNIIIIQAHMGSTRLPGKIMKLLDDKPVIWHVYERCLQVKNVQKVVIATSKNKENDILEAYCKEQKIECFRGEEEDVLDRYYECCKHYLPHIIVRITSDCPLLEPKLIDYWLENMMHDKVEFIEEEKTLFKGFGTDIFSYEALVKMKERAYTAKQKEHVVGYYIDHKDEFSSKQYKLPENLHYLYSKNRLTLDTQEDYELLHHLYHKFKASPIINLEEVMKYLDETEDIRVINKSVVQREY